MQNVRFIAAMLLLPLAGCASGARTAPGSTPQARSAEDVTAAYMESIRDNPGELLLFLREMPKGGDLHNHLSGSVYAESFIEWAVQDGMCLTTATLSLSPPPCTKRDGEVPASNIPRNPALFGDVIDAWSMRNWDPARENGHDQFFDSFAKFSAPDHRIGDMLAEVVSRAAAQNLSYMELMFGPDRGRAIGLGRRVGFHTDFGRMRERLLAAGLRDSLNVARREIDRTEARQNALMGCDKSPKPPACATVVRYLYQVLRGLPPETVFAQILAGFELTRMDRRFVGFNLVMPEDHPVPMRDFSLHMRMIDYLHSIYPEVRITLHAGELAEGLVPPEGMSFHIRESIERGHASRIGHGTAVLYENDPVGLMRRMAERKILVEVALSSSDGILGIRGKAHPITTYLKHGVPIALATDDEGVSRSSITREYRKAVEEQGLDYRAIKTMARNSIAYAFVEDSTKTRLLAGIDSAFNRFEERYAAVPRKR
jgi:adenosine deaminase